MTAIKEGYYYTFPRISPKPVMVVRDEGHTVVLRTMTGGKVKVSRFYALQFGVEYNP
jgi:hypothetical protein